MKLALVAFLAFGSICAAEKSEPLSVRGVDGFGSPEKLLRELAAAKSKLPVHHFCVVGYKHAGSGETTAWVHWIERAALILWEPSDVPEPLARSRRYLDLKKDVVASQDNLQGSTYKVTQSWVDGVIADCAKAGDKYTITAASKPARKPISTK
jgi:hypothetical protein